MQGRRPENVFNLPNLLTILRIVLLPAIIQRFLRGDMSGALSVYLVAMLSDAADGFIARRFHQVTDLGKLLDPIADKLCLITLLALFVHDGQISKWMMMIILLKEAILIAGSLAALRMGIVVHALPIGKLTTIAFIASMIARFLSLRMPADILLWISVLLSLISLFWYSAALIEKIWLRKAAI